MLVIWIRDRYMLSSLFYFPLWLLYLFTYFEFKGEGLSFEIECDKILLLLANMKLRGT